MAKSISASILKAENDFIKLKRELLYLESRLLRQKLKLNAEEQRRMSKRKREIKEALMPALPF